MALLLFEIKPYRPEGDKGFPMGGLSFPPDSARLTPKIPMESFHPIEDQKMRYDSFSQEQKG